MTTMTTSVAHNWWCCVCSFALPQFCLGSVPSWMTNGYTLFIFFLFFKKYWLYSSFFPVIWNFQLTFHWLQCILDQILKWTSGCKFISQGLIRQPSRNKYLQIFCFDSLWMSYCKNLVVLGTVTQWLQQQRQRGIDNVLTCCSLILLFPFQKYSSTYFWLCRPIHRIYSSAELMLVLEGYVLNFSHSI